MAAVGGITASCRAQRRDRAVRVALANQSSLDDGRTLCCTIATLLLYVMRAMGLIYPVRRTSSACVARGQTVSFVPLIRLLRPSYRPVLQWKE